MSDFCMIQLASGDLCISSDNSGEITIWDYQTYQKMKTIKIHQRYAKIKCMVLLNDRRVAVGLAMHYPVLRDSNIGSDTESEEQQVEHDVCIYNIDTGKAEQILKNVVANDMVQLSDGRLCCKSNSGEVTVWK
jgi:hypothetical protein